MKLVIVHKWQNLDDIQAWLQHQLANVEAELKRLKEAESNHKSVNFDGTSDTMQIEKKG